MLIWGKMGIIGGMKKILISGVVLMVVVPQIALASWWNPTTWQIFKKNVASTQQATSSSSKIITETENDSFRGWENTATSTMSSTSVDISTKLELTDNTFTRSLSIGMEGSDVRVLQVLLTKDKSIYPEGKITGNFDIDTKKAVQRFQDKYKLATPEQKLTANYGAAGPKTFKMLENVFGRTKTAISTKGIDAIAVKNTPPKTLPQNPPTTKQDLQSNDQSLVALRIISPNGGEEFYAGGATTPIKFSVSGLPLDAEKKGYSIKVGFKGLPFGSRVNLPTNIPLTNFTSREFPWQILQPDDNLSDEWNDFEFGKMTVEVEKIEKKEFTPEEIRTIENSGIDPSTVPTRYVSTIIASDESDSNIKVYKTTKSFIDDSTGGYKQRGTVTLGKNNVLDVWGGRFLIRLDSILGNTANFTTLFENKQNGMLSVTLGQSNPMVITGTDVLSNATHSYKYSGRVTFKSMPIKNLGIFVLDMDTDAPVETGSTSIPMPAGTMTTPKGLATLTVTPVSGANYSVKISGQYNLLGKICIPAHYRLDYGDGKSEILDSNSCDSINYSKTHVYPAGTFVATISWYRATSGNWTNYVQAENLITVSNTGEVTVKVIDPFSIIKG